MVRIRRFGVLRTATVAAVIYFILTAVFAIPAALIFSAAPPATLTDQFGRTVQFNISPLFVLVLPFIYAGFGWIFTAVACLIYNLAAPFTVGIEFEAVAVTSAPPPVPKSQAPPPAASPPAAPAG